jgi:ferritin
MISGKMQKALNDQINAELFSSYLYLSMAAYFEKTKFHGFANWMKIQAEEEHAHGLKFFDFLITVGGQVSLEAIAKPQAEWSSAKNVFEESLKHEMYITERINKLVDLAMEERDHAVRSFLNWFVDEQVEEMNNVQEILDKFEIIGESKGSLFMLDRELGKRALTVSGPAV